MAIPSQQFQITKSFFHALGKLNTESSQYLFESISKSSHNVLSKEVWTEEVPYAVDATTADANVAAYPAMIRKYTQTSLTEVAGSNGQAYYINNSGPVGSLIAPVDVPSSGIPSYGYRAILYKSDNSIIPETAGVFVIDYYSGIVMFQNGYTPAAMGWGVPKMTCYAYVGQKSSDSAAQVLSVFATVSANSSFWTGGGLPDYVFKSYTGSVDPIINSTFSTLQSNSGNWESVFATVCAYSAQWAVSGGITSGLMTKSEFKAYSSVNTPKLDSVYATVETHSAEWAISGGSVTSGQLSAYLKKSDFESYSGNIDVKLNSVYSTVEANSAQWALSGQITSGELSAYLKKIDFESYSGQIVINQHAQDLEITGKLIRSEFESYSGIVGPKLDSVYSTVEANSAQWVLSGQVTSGQLSAYLKKIDFESYSGQIKIDQHSQDLEITGKVSFATYSQGQHAQDLEITGKLVRSEFESYSGIVGSKLDSVFSTVLSNSAEWALSGGVTSGFALKSHVHSASAIVSGNLNAARMPVSGMWYLSGDLDIADNAPIPNSILYIDRANRRIGLGTTTPAASIDIAATGEALRFSIPMLPSIYGSFGGYGTSGYVGMNLVDPSDLVLNEFSYAFDGVRKFGTKKDGLLTVYTPSYETIVINNNDIPNKKYVDNTLKTYSGKIAIDQHAQDLAISGKLIRSEFESYSGIVGPKLDSVYSTVQSHSAEWNLSGGPAGLYVTVTGIQTITGKKTFTKLVQQNGSDSTLTGVIQENGFRSNVTTDLDSNFVHALSGSDKWTLGTWRGEQAEFWYLTNGNAQKDVMVVTDSGRIGINRQSNIMNYHAYYRGTVGVGYNDMIIGGTYTGEAQVWYNFQIQTDTNTFKWRKSLDNRATWLSFSSALAVSTTPVSIENGITAAFEHAIGHTIANTWEIIAYPQAPQATLSVAPMRFEEILTSTNYALTAHNDYTAELSNYSDDTGTGVTLLDIGSTAAAFYVGGLSKYRSVFINLKTAAVTPSTTCLLLADYWNGSAWTPLTITDGTDGLIGPSHVTMRASGIVSWNKPVDWSLRQLEGEGTNYILYWIRFRVSTTNITTAPAARCITRNGDKIIAAYCSALDYEPMFHVNALGYTVIGNTNGISSKMLTVSDVLNPTSLAGGNGMAVNFNAGGGIYMKGGACEGKFESFSNIIQIGAMTQHPLALYANNEERMTFPATFFGSDILQTNAQVLAIRTSAVSHTPVAMSDGFGAGFSFVVMDNDNVRNTLALVGAVRNGSDNTGDFVIQTATSGVITEKMRVKNNGTIKAVTANYETLVIADNDIPNKKYVDNVVSGLITHSQFTSYTGVTTPKLNSVYSTVQTHSAEWAISGGSVTSGQLSGYLKKSEFKSYSGQIAIDQHAQDLAITGRVSLTNYSYMYVGFEPTGAIYPGIKGQMYVNETSGILYTCVNTNKWLRFFGARTW